MDQFENNVFNIIIRITNVNFRRINHLSELMMANCVSYLRYIANVLLVYGCALSVNGYALAGPHIETATSMQTIQATC